MMSWNQTPLTERLGIRYPLIQAPMGNGVGSPALVAAISNAGGLGTLASGHADPERLRQEIVDTRALTDGPFAVHLHCHPVPERDLVSIAQTQARLHPLRERLGLPARDDFVDASPRLSEQLAVALEEGVAAVGFSFGVPEPEVMETLREAGVLTWGTATHLAEAIVLEEAGMDWVVAQGAEAAAERATFIGTPERALVGTQPLVALLTRHLHVPVVAAGGIMDGRGWAAALTLGAAGVQLGTAFVAAAESGAHSAYKRAVLKATEVDSILTRGLSGRLARALRNGLTDALAPIEDQAPAFPLQHWILQDIREAAARSGKADHMALWAGQGCALCRAEPAAILITEWAAQAGRLLAGSASGPRERR